MRIVIIGGTGLIGTKVVSRLRQHGHDAVPAAPDTGVNTITGEGLAEVLEGADVVVDVSNSPSFEDQAVLDFFTRSTTNLMEAEKAAGVKHHVLLSVVGTHRLSQSGYFRAKVAQEELVGASGIPFSIVHATQFFEFLKAIAGAATEGNTVRLAPVLFQPMASDDVASAVGRTAAGPPTNATAEVAGPEVYRLDQLIERRLRAVGDPRQVISDLTARYFGAELSERTLLPGADAIIWPTRLADWLEQAGRVQQASSASASHAPGASEQTTPTANPA
jgi:uncharacterized protein YbjT (DUF2867 family)